MKMQIRASAAESGAVARTKGRLLRLALAQEEIDTVDQLSAGKRLGDVIVGAEFVPA
jgi:hypothetical protein